MRSVLLTAVFTSLLTGAAMADVPPPADLKPPRSFTIFFQHAEPNIPDDADSLLPQIAEIFARIGYSAIAIECHSDNVASQAINVPLTEDRARRIKTELVRYGVPDSAITAVGLGFSDPLIPEAPFETAVSNRRCIIGLS